MTDSLRSITICTHAYFKIPLIITFHGIILSQCTVTVKSDTGTQAKETPKGLQ